MDVLFDCPAQYQTSPKVRWLRVASVVLVQPLLQCAKIVTSPPCPAGCRNAFQLPSASAVVSTV